MVSHTLRFFFHSVPKTYQVLERSIVLTDCSYEVRLDILGYNSSHKHGNQEKLNKIRKL